MLEGFDEVTDKGMTALVRSGMERALVSALLDDTGLRPAGEGGRGEVHALPLADGEAIIRRYRRGGLASVVLKDRYMVNRPLRELRVHEYLYRNGLAVPEPLGAAWERTGMLVRGAIATRGIDGAHLQEYLETTPKPSEALLRDVGRQILRMHELGVYHADLQVRNILVGADGVFIIDFDNATLAKRVSRVGRARNLLRLRRSFQKNGLPSMWFELVREGHGLQDWPLALDAAYRVKARLSDALRRR